MTHTNQHWLAAACSALLLACSGGADRGLRVGQEPSTGGRGAGNGSAGFDSPSGQGASGGDAIGSNALTVSVQDIEEMTIEVITLACAGDCADVQAVASGGNPPYAFAWDDGSESATRRVCLDASATLTVSATDTGIDTEEFRYDAHTADTTLTANVLACTDAGTDAGTDTELCLDNPSFEGTPRLYFDLQPFDAPPWQECVLTPDIIGAADTVRGTPDPTEGETFLGGNEEAASSALCAPLLAGDVVHLLIDVAGTELAGPGGSWEIYGSTREPCAEDELLGETRPTVSANTWETQCLTLRPSQRIEALTLHARDAYVIADNLRTVARCP